MCLFACLFLILFVCIKFANSFTRFNFVYLHQICLLVSICLVIRIKWFVYSYQNIRLCVSDVQSEVVLTVFRDTYDDVPNLFCVICLVHNYVRMAKHQ